METHTAASITDNTFFFGRYVDDILVLLKDKEALEFVKHALNKVDPAVQFTSEVETDGHLPFLDMDIHHEGQDFALAWYHKTTWTGQYLHFYSYVPLLWKRGLLNGLKNRIMRICSPQYLPAACEALSDALKLNAYPQKFIDEHFLEYTDNTPRKSSQKVVKQNVYIRLPYQGESNTAYYTNRLNRAIASVYPSVRLIVRHIMNPAMVPSVKEPQPIASTSSVVYQFQCACSADYVGRTEARLDTRAAQHIPSWVTTKTKTRPRSTRPPQSAITRHLMECQHAVPLPAIASFKILHRGQHRTMNRILEALKIKARSPSLCVQKEYLYDLKIHWT